MFLQIWCRNFQGFRCPRGSARTFLELPISNLPIKRCLTSRVFPVPCFSNLLLFLRPIFAFKYQVHAFLQRKVAPSLAFVSLPCCSSLKCQGIGLQSINGSNLQLRRLAAQCAIPPHIAIPFRDSIAEGGIALICLVFILSFPGGSTVKPS